MSANVMSRRGFAGVAGVAGIGMAATGFVGAAAARADEVSASVGNLPAEWDAEADVVVIGMGGAGLSLLQQSSLEQSRSLHSRRPLRKKQVARLVFPVTC